MSASSKFDIRRPARLLSNQSEVKGVRPPLSLTLCGSEPAGSGGHICLSRRFQALAKHAQLRHGKLDSSNSLCLQTLTSLPVLVLGRAETGNGRRGMRGRGQRDPNIVEPAVFTTYD